MKITRFKDIPLFTRDGDYEVDYPIHRLISFIDELEKELGLQLNPDFQRGHVWNEEQQTAYIEFILKGGRTARVIYLNYPSWKTTVKNGEYNDFVCVDGLQRITAVRQFFNNQIKCFGSYYNEYTDDPRIMQDTIRVNINDLKTKREVLQWYIDFNSGGTIHTNEEIERVKELLREER